MVKPATEDELVRLADEVIKTDFENMRKRKQLADAMNSVDWGGMKTFCHKLADILRMIDKKGTKMTDDEKPELTLEEQRQLVAEEEAIRGWDILEHAGTLCSNCGMLSLYTTRNKKMRCVKCNWVPQDRATAPVPLPEKTSSDHF